MTTKDNPINKNETEFSLFKKWAKFYWFIKFFDDKVVVEKGRTRKQFKFAYYETNEELQNDIQKYLSVDYCQWRTKK